MFVLPSTKFELTPLIHCSTNRLALCSALDHSATTAKYIYSFNSRSVTLSRIYVCMYMNTHTHKTRLDTCIVCVCIFLYSLLFCSTVMRGININWRPSSCGLSSVNFYILIFFSEITWPIWNKLVGNIIGLSSKSLCFILLIWNTKKKQEVHRCQKG